MFIKNIKCFVYTIGVCAVLTSTMLFSVPFHENGIVSEPVKTIFSLLGQKIQTLEEANAFAQKNLLRSGERWDKQEETPVVSAMREHSPAIFNEVQKLGMIDACFPENKTFSYALLMGSLQAGVVLRLTFLQRLYEQGYRFDYIVLLSGMRELRDIEKAVLPDHIKTEADMMKYEYEKCACFKDIPMLLINAPMKQKPDGSLTRPTTDDTLKYFAQEAPKPGTCLVISNNPYAMRQVKTTRRMLDQTKFPVTYACKEADAELDVFLLMDEFARTIYEEKKRWDAKN